MRIGIDGNEANVSNRVGIGEYAFQLLKEFEKLHPSTVKFTLFLKNPPMHDLPQKWSKRIIGPRKFWTQIGLPFNLFTQSSKPDIFFSPSHYAPRFSPVPTAISIMDVSYLSFPELFNKNDLYQLKNWTAYSAKNASVIFTISQSSKNDIIKYYKVQESKIVVTYPGIKQVDKNFVSKMSMEDLQKKYGISSKYILFVGTLQPRKNICRLIESFAEIYKKHKDIDLVIVGKKGWLYEEILAAPKKYEITSQVKFLDFLPDEEVATLYQNAICYVLPSLYEGFGLPVLESMKYGCPVITSNVSSLPEAGGDAALYVNPEDVQDIAQKILQLIEDKTLRKTLIEKGYVHVKQFSWEKTAKKTLAVLEEIGAR